MTNPRSDCISFKFLSRNTWFLRSVGRWTENRNIGCKKVDTPSSRVFLFFCWRRIFARIAKDTQLGRESFLHFLRIWDLKERSNCLPRDFPAEDRNEVTLVDLSGKAKRRSEGISIRFFVSRLFFHPRFFFFFFPLHAYNLRIHAYTRHVFAQLLINGATQSSKNRGTTAER